MTHHVLYVPGLGDHKSQGQQTVVRWWRVFGVQGHLVPMHWLGQERFVPKLRRLLAEIDRLAVDGNEVSLVGTSAGASAVLVAFAQRQEKIAGVVCICGKINHPETIHPERFAQNPGFRDSLAELQTMLPKLGPEARRRIMSVHPLVDGSVPPADTIIPGAREKLIPTFGHAFSIAMTLVFGAYGLIRFLKSKA